MPAEARGSTLRVIAAIEDRDAARRILECLKLPARAPLLGEVTGRHSGPSEQDDDRFFDQSAGCDWP
jgi:hypothetical protein